MRIDRVTVDLGQGEIAARVTFVARSLVKPFDSLRVLAFDSDRYKRIENSKYETEQLGRRDAPRSLAETRQDCVQLLGVD